ncbi:manganese efflux pump [Bacillaceae bacterium SIJ1]|uniref:manganese efflux pump MntP n=1 Tax=Litoribacterium kuwaitense TaxID=1398745 RepID=UPI0013EAC11C|nr:manganese efflux pump MntP family protein [Litoribacterium kuwaitense]NGP44724.1 manganese efflux pump [Litoribacterium kuwaitense]
MSLSVLALALSMDAFSVSIGLGTVRLRALQMFHMAFLVGVFHVGMPLAGIGIGKALSQHMGQGATVIAGLLLLVLGGQMIYQAFTDEQAVNTRPRGIALLSFCIGVSLDSFSAGLSLGMSGAHMWLSICLMGLISMMMTWAGLWLGGKLSHWLGAYSQVLGGFVLCVFGLKYIL